MFLETKFQRTWRQGKADRRGRGQGSSFPLCPGPLPPFQACLRGYGPCTGPQHPACLVILLARQAISWAPLWGGGPRLCPSLLAEQNILQFWLRKRASPESTNPWLSLGLQGMHTLLAKTTSPSGCFKKGGSSQWPAVCLFYSLQNVLLTASDSPQAHQILISVTFSKYPLHDFLKLM